jgi:plastocyanin
MLRLALGAVLLVVALAAPAWADDASIGLTIKDQHFVPDTIEIPAGKKVKLVIRNEDKTVSEFESVDLHREKVVVPGGEITVYVGPLDAGTYEFFDDFHPGNRGHLIAK